jgi:thymidylate synthase ThyX
VPYLVETASALDGLNVPVADHRPADFCTLVDYDRDGEEKVLAAALYRFGEMPMADALNYVRGLSDAGCNDLAATLLNRLDAHDVPLRELEYCTYTFDLLMDQGAYAEFKRHRMMTQSAQKLSTRLGYAMPRLIAEAGFGSKYKAAMLAAAELYEKLHAFSPEIAQYVVPNAYNRRVLARFNLREAYAFCQLRSAPNAHFSIRRVAQRIYETIRRVHPRLTGYMHLPAETWQQVEEAHFAEC